MTQVHYTYITRSPDGRYYIGVRSCEGDPASDPYMGSHSDPTYSPSRKRILATFDSREEAYEHEIYLHDVRQVDANPRYANRARQKSTGFFYNQGTPGESHPMWGKHHTEDARAKISAVHKGRPSHLKGRSLSEEHRVKISAGISGELNPMYGRPRSDDTKRKLREANIGKEIPAEVRQKISESSGEWWGSEEGGAKRVELSERFSGEGNPFHGHSHSKETKARLSEVHSGKTISEEQKKKIREKISSTRWFHDPVTGKTIRCAPEDCPEGYILGRGKTVLTVNVD